MSKFRVYGMTILIALLVAIYTMSSAGKFHIVDEVSLFAVTESLATRGEVDTNTIAWTQWVNSPGEVLGAFGPTGEVYSKKGPAPAFVAVPWYWTLRLFGLTDFTVGMLQSTLLWNGIVTALTAALLWLTAARLGYGERTGMALGLLFGLATIAWPYANHFFGEPLSAFSLLLTFYGILAWRRTGGLGWMVLAGIGAGLAITTVTAHTLLVGVLGLYALAAWWFDDKAAGDDAGASRNVAALVRALLAFAAPVLIAGVLLLLYNFVRFGNPLDTGYHFDSGEGFTTPIWQGFWGLVVSPYRGVFWHTPFFFAGLIGIVPFFRRHRLEAATIGALSVVLVGLYSMWWMWWGGFAWGPRFLVPLTPFWVLVTAPVVARVVGDALRHVPGAAATDAAATGADGDVTAMREPWGVGGVALVLLAALSLLVQIAAVSANYVNYEIELRSLFPTNWDNPLEFGPPAQSLADFLRSPVFGQFKMLRADPVANSDLAWLWPSGNIQWLVVLVGALAILTLGAALVLWWRDAGSGRRAYVPGGVMWGILLFLPLLLMATWSGEVTRTGHYGEPHVGYRAALEELCRVADTDDAIITIAPFTYQIPMNWMPVLCRDGLPMYGYAKNSLDHPEAQAALERLRQDYDRIWFVTGGLPVNDPENGIERWLADAAYKADDHWYDDYRLVRFATPNLIEGAPTHELNLPLVDDGPHRVLIQGMRAPDSILAGDVLPVDIYYRLETPPQADLRWFVQLISPEGQASALLDTAPEDGYVMFTALPVGEDLVERAGLQIPLDAAPGTYQLIAGLYNPQVEGGPRLRSPDGSDFVELGKVMIEARTR